MPRYVGTFLDLKNERMLDLPERVDELSVGGVTVIIGAAELGMADAGPPAVDVPSVESESGVLSSGCLAGKSVTLLLAISWT